jgi:hypothetical protein
MTATMVLARLGHEKPSNGQFKECHAVLREFLGEPTHSNGQNWYRVPLVEKPSTLQY